MNIIVTGGVGFIGSALIRIIMNKLYGMKLQRAVNRIDYGQHELNHKIERAEREKFAEQEH